VEEEKVLERTEEGFCFVVLQWLLRPFFFLRCWAAEALEPVSLTDPLCMGYHFYKKLQITGVFVCPENYFLNFSVFIYY
jgi:hypothetical protein